MFNEPQKLIVVYKDELVLNQLKKLIDTNDDDVENGTIIGTEDGSVTIISWDEKMWLDQKRAGNITSKILFIGDIKDSDKLLPFIDVKYEKWGIKYGWAGKQAIIIANENAVSNKEEYEKFLTEFKGFALPEQEKEEIPIIAAKKAVIGAFFGLFGLGVSFTVDFFMDKSKVRQQLYLYGIVELYKNHLESFMKA